MSRDDERGRDLELTAFFAAIALFCSTLEYLIPKPLPFIRLGLANLPLMLSFPVLGWGEYLWLLTLKIIGQGLVNGTLFSFVFVLSLAGTIASGLLMRLLWEAGIRGKRPLFSYIGISVVGALSSNCAQILTAQTLFFGAGIWVIAAPMLAVGLVSSTFLGWMANGYAAHSRWYARIVEHQASPARFRAIFATKRRWTADERIVPIVIGMATLPAIFFQPSVPFLVADAIVAILLAVSSGRKFKVAPSLALLCAMLLAHLFQPSGRILLQIGRFAITEGALQEGLKKSMVLIAMVYVSQYMTSGRPNLPGVLGKLLSIQLAYFGEFSRHWKRQGASDSGSHTVMERIDALLARIGSEEEPESDAKETGSKSCRSAIIAGCCALIAMYGLLIGKILT